MRFNQFIGVLEVLAQTETGATVGQIQKFNLFMTRGQVERALKELIADDFVKVEKVYYRSNLNKNVYHITERAVEYCEFVITKYDRRAKQKEIPQVDYMHVAGADVYEKVEA